MTGTHPTAGGTRAIRKDDPDYPENLRGIGDSPDVLFLRGGLLPRDRIAVAVVGTRSATPTGMAVAREIASDLARAGATVVSGLAVGIDAQAHAGAIDAGGRTVACLGTGVDVVYPRINARMFRVIPSHGALLSEYGDGTPPAPWRFPERNRIISGLSLGVVVVEAGARSGALITADHALRHGRPVMAVPGSVKSACSAGCNRLIQEGAYLVTSAQDILSFLGREGECVPDAYPPDLSRLREVSLEEAAVLEAVRREPATADRLTESLPGIPPGKLLALLSALEVKGLIEKAAAGKYLARG